MKDIFMFLIVNLLKFGDLKVATFYEDSTARIELKEKGKLYTISIMQENIQEEE